MENKKMDGMLELDDDALEMTTGGTTGPTITAEVYCRNCKEKVYVTIDPTTLMGTCPKCGAQRRCPIQIP